MEDEIGGIRPCKRFKKGYPTLNVPSAHPIPIRCMECGRVTAGRLYTMYERFTKEEGMGENAALDRMEQILKRKLPSHCRKVFLTHRDLHHTPNS